jgi:hypothetical protein
VPISRLHMFFTNLIIKNIRYFEPWKSRPHDFLIINTFVGNQLAQYDLIKRRTSIKFKSNSLNEKLKKWAPDDQQLKNSDYCMTKNKSIVATRKTRTSYEERIFLYQAFSVIISMFNNLLIVNFIFIKTSHMLLMSMFFFEPN